MRGSNGVSLPKIASVVSAPATRAAEKTFSVGEQALECECGRDLRAVDEGEAFFRFERTSGSRPARLERVGSRSFRSRDI